MSGTVISDIGTVDYAGGSGLKVVIPTTFSGNVVVDGDATFTGAVSGVTAAPTPILVSEPGAPSATTTYDCDNNIRFFKHSAAMPSSNITGDFVNLGLNNGESTTVKIVALGSGVIDNTDRYLEAAKYDGSAVTTFVASSASGLKAKKGTTTNLWTLEVIKDSVGAVHVYGIADEDLKP